MEGASHFFASVFESFGALDWFTTVLVVPGLALAWWLMSRCPRSSDSFGERDLAFPIVIVGAAAYLLAQPLFYFSLRESSPREFFLLAGLQRLGFALLVVVAARRLLASGNPLRLEFASSWHKVTWGLGIYVSVLPFVLFMGLFRNKEVVQNSAQQLLDSESTGLSVVMFATLVLITPFFEEVVFRGLIQGGLRRANEGGLSIFIASLLFMLVHERELWPQVLLLGAVLGIVYEITRTLWVPIAVHMLHNLIAFVYFWRFASPD
ncbi:MAG: type II CAAX endopeptidase family protein [Planctomycetota bacterium]